MRLLYFTPLLSTVGGQERTLTDKANWLAAQGHEVLFVTYEHEGPLAYQLHDGVGHTDIACHYFSLYRYPVWRRPWELLRLKRAFRRKMRAVLLQFQPDVIVVPIPNTENFLWDVMRAVGRVPVIIESHLSYGHAVIKRGLTEKWLYCFERPEHAVRRAAKLIVLTQGDADAWRRRGVERIAVVPNPVTRYPDPLPPAANPVPRRIICVGRFTAQKRLDRLIDAFALLADRYPGWHVDIFGYGEDKELLSRRIEACRLADRIRLLPPTPAIYDEYRRSQFLVLSSDFEGFGLVIVEAMACGLPVVATACPCGPSEIIDDGVTGLLSELNVQDLAAKMEWMMSHDEERAAMGRRAHQAAARYRLDTVMPLWEQAYLSCDTPTTAAS